jgi:hypothetical protein
MGSDVKMMEHMAYISGGAATHCNTHTLVTLSVSVLTGAHTRGDFFI